MDDRLASALRIVFIDDDLIVVDKPSGMPSVPARTPLDPPDVARVLAASYGPLEAVHRLDRDTSGLLVLSRSREVRRLLGRAFEARAISKRYLAVVHGTPPANEGTIHLPLADDPDRAPRKRVDPIGGRRATTRWWTRARRAAGSTAGCGDPLTLVELEPVTGRSHQLRVHLAWLGCPLVNDRLYGRGVDGPLALQAMSIAFSHPRTAVPLSLSVAPAVGPPWSSFTSGSA